MRRVHGPVMNLLHPAQPGPVLNRVTASNAGWQALNMEVRALRAGESWDLNFPGFETVAVVLGGKFECRGHTIGRREHVFDGMPHALFFGRDDGDEIRALTPCEVACAWVPTDRDAPTRVVTPEQCAVEIRGGGHATRQINSILPPGFPCTRLVCVEVFTPGGNWSSYPPHKHDEHIMRGQELVEAELEEFYFYKIRPSPDGSQRGYAVQRVYTGDRELDFVGVAHDNDIITVPRGYHPVSAAHGYDCYYLNFLAGSAQSLANSDDPDYAWVKENWPPRDPRLPLVTLDMES